MRTLWNTFSRPAAVLALLITLGVWLYVALDLGIAYRNSRWLTIAHAPFFAFGLYTYLTVAFNIAGAKPSALRFLGLMAWVIVGAIVPYSIAYGFVLLLMYAGFLIPELTYLPLGLGMLETAMHVTWLGFLAAVFYSAWLLWCRRSNRGLSIRSVDA